MARGKRGLTLDEQLAKVTDEIASTENALKEMRKLKKDLEEQIKLTRLAELDEMIKESGLSFDEVKNMLKK